ncbi:unnamed protein product [Meganyctiphanes norvegica]|uniref:Uncharacterized protein n=1 Tax=Meganyctiphanes norvegica TaxID=48144 RepID=A0AAV2R8F7_MEGNR
MIKMGQCHNCQWSRRSRRTSKTQEDESLSLTTKEGKELNSCSGPESTGDSGHSSDCSSCCGEHLVRSSRSQSESSGRFSLRDSIASYGEPQSVREMNCTNKCNIIRGSNDYNSSKGSLSRGSNGSYCHICDQQHDGTSGLPYSSILDLPVFPEDSEHIDTQMGIIRNPTSSVTPAINFRHRHYLHQCRKVSRSSSGRESHSSIGSITAILRARLTRSTSLRMSPTEAEVHDIETKTSSVIESSQKTNRPRRSVSLRLPLTQKPTDNSETTIPTIYVADTPQCQTSNNDSRNRKHSVRRALSLLSVNSLNSLLKHESRSHPPKPVQRILRQPRRRHQTVRGISGLAIDASNQEMNGVYRDRAICGLYRSNTVYYPTATSLRSTYANRRTRSGM